MVVQKSKRSRSRRGAGRAHYFLVPKGWTICAETGEPVPPHRDCFWDRVHRLNPHGGVGRPALEEAPSRGVEIAALPNPRPAIQGIQRRRTGEVAERYHRDRRTVPLGDGDDWSCAIGVFLRARASRL